MVFPSGLKANNSLMEHRYLFVSGLHRSGTTLLAKLIGNHPQISGFERTGVKRDEGQFLQTLYPAAAEFGGPGKFGFAKEMHLTEASPLLMGKNKEHLFQEWSKYWDLEKPYLMEKSPPNLIKTRFLQEAFPSSYFIVIMRHPVANAYATFKWSKTSIKELIKHWVVCHQIYVEDKPFLHRVLEIKYELLVKEPVKQLQRISVFLNIEEFPCETNMIEDHNKKYFHKWQQKQQGWIKSRFFRKQYANLESQIRPFGYSLFDLDLIEESVSFV